MQSSIVPHTIGARSSIRDRPATALIFVSARM